MNKLTVSGNQSFMGKEIPVVLGGFGPDKKCVSDKTIAEIHGMREPDVRRRITDNIKRFNENIDFIDMKSCASDAQQFLSQLCYTPMQISKAEHIYILSERGYAKLIKIMDSDLAWEIHDKLIDEYFALREGQGKSSILPETKKMEATAKFNNSRARVANLWLKIAENAPEPEYKQVCAAYASQELAGKPVLPLPEAGEKHFSATEVGAFFGISSQKVGTLSNSHGLKTERYGKWYHDKSPYSAKQVDTFKYNWEGIKRFAELLGKPAPQRPLSNAS